MYYLAENLDTNHEEPAGLQRFLLGEPPSYYLKQTYQPNWVEILVNCPESYQYKNQFKSIKTPEEASEEIEKEEIQLYTYRIPAGVEIYPGNLVIVPFGKQQLGGLVVRFTSQIPTYLKEEQIKEITQVLPVKFLPLPYLQLLQQVAYYYCTPLIKVLCATLPPKLLPKIQQRLRLKQLPVDYAEQLANKKALEIIEVLKNSAGHNLTKIAIKRKIKNCDDGLKILRDKGWLESYYETTKTIEAKQQTWVNLTNDKISLGFTPQQTKIIQTLRQFGGQMPLTDLLAKAKITKVFLDKLVNKNCLEIITKSIPRIPFSPEQIPDQPKTLTPSQKQALEQINSITGYQQFLLHGVTGSGKTEIYLQAITPILKNNKSALVIVPEIGLTPQLTDRFRARFGEQVLIYHSALSDGERYDTWRQMLEREPQIIIGTRSAIFAPLPNLGMIILDEEHDSSYKQDQPAPTYHARTVAQWRAQLTGCPLILGSATPASETWLQTQSPSNCIYLSLPQRVEGRSLPPIQIVDMRQQLRDGNRSIFSRPLQQALHQLALKKQQGILFIHRRGHSTFVSCRSCGYVIECPNCDVSLAYHFHGETDSPSPEAAQGRLRCHYCGHQTQQPQRCPECQSPYFKHFGSGTQRIEQELAKQFPQLQVIRFDSDTTRNKDAHRQLLTRFANGEADLLIGTQMLTKGLDLPQVTLVGVIAADGLLNLPDYRASERAFQTLTQVAGRAGRGQESGQVIIQTYTPTHPVIEAVQQHNYQNFIAAELAERAALSYPPYGRLILLRLSGINELQVKNTAQNLAKYLQESPGKHQILGPAPAPILRIANNYRWQILLKYPPHQPINLSIISELYSQCRSSQIRLNVDIDPINLS